MNGNRLRPIEIVLAVAAMAVFGGTFAVAKIALRGLRPAELACIRFALAAAVLAPLHYRSQPASARPDRSTRRRLFFIALLAVTFAYMLENTALQHVNASVAGFIVTSMPAFLAVIAVPFLGERFTRNKGIALILTTAGIASISYNGDPEILRRRAEWIGILLMVSVAVVEAFSAILIKKVLGKISPLSLTFWLSFYGAIGLLPLAIRETVASAGPRPIGPSVVAAVLYLALGASLFAFHAYYTILAKMEASRAAFFLYLIPLFATAAGVLFFGERITIWFVAGSLLILGGVALVQRGTKEEPGTLAVG